MQNRHDRILNWNKVVADRSIARTANRTLLLGTVGHWEAKKNRKTDQTA